jgi:hypothetical protein
LKKGSWFLAMDSGEKMVGLIYNYMPTTSVPKIEDFEAKSGDFSNI